MERVGFIRDMLDVKVLILYVMARVERPVSGDEIYALCFQDDTLTYFDVKEALPQMVNTGHLEELQPDSFTITEKGLSQGRILEDSVAAPLAQRVAAGIEEFNRESRRREQIKTEIKQHSEKEFTVSLDLNSQAGHLLYLELPASDSSQARTLERIFRDNAEKIFHDVMSSVINLTKSSRHEDV